MLSTPPKEEFEEFADKLGHQLTDDRPEPGDFYMTGSDDHGGPTLMRCEKIEDGRVFPVNRRFPFPIEMCFRVKTGS